MRHVIVAGLDGKYHPASWSSQTGELSGDPVILHVAKGMKTITVHPHDGEVPIDWNDATTAVPALMDAAQFTYGKPVDHFVFPEHGEKPPVMPSTSKAPSAA